MLYVCLFFVQGEMTILEASIEFFISIQSKAQYKKRAFQRVASAGCS